MSTPKLILEERRTRPYVPIRDYALIGDCHGAALVSLDGSVDWCALGRFDQAPICWRILDAFQGGLFHIRPEEKTYAAREYLPRTNVLRTTFTTEQGGATLTDFMPVSSKTNSSLHDTKIPAAPGWLIRIVEATAGEINLRIRFESNARGFAPAAQKSSSVREAALYSDCGLSGSDVDDVIKLSAGQRCAFVVATEPPADCSLNLVDTLLSNTRSFWENWVSQCCYDGPYNDAVYRSALVIKLLTYAPTGAIVAAPITSLPEEIGGERNWDYRFSWLRDSSLMLNALAALGYSADAARFCDFQQSCCVATLPALQIMFGIDGATDLPEYTLDHLDGYGQSRPVRVGNAAHAQYQADIYGEVLEWLAVMRELRGEPDSTQQELVARIADHVADHWQDRDQGLWEMRSEPRHYVHSKLMSWVALDRAIQLGGDHSRWRQARDAVFAAILEHGIDSNKQFLVQAFGFDVMDAALLLAPTLGTPLDDEILVRTVAAVRTELGFGDYVRRYIPNDGVSGSEGAFLMCSFWLVDALLFTDQAEEARALFERLIEKSNDVGLYSEEIDPQTDAFLGNFPQGFTHLGLINSAINLSLYERGGIAALHGTQVQRTRRATAGIPAAKLASSSTHS
ncbi:glycoside hydrolase family 15 protein [Burkholderia cenocepacia]|uniref:glycoside hydrolase family 15 protein n=2 Tax=Burkholderia cenocepacia TaxID=95486 RepID=UPI0009B2C819|nr:glycoside hydrolase family 15 protein [Burkholderia cenocepacia]